jgi:chemotaxis protein MotB
MRRRRRFEEHVNHERWLVSYADFITLLFAFFVVLYASSQVDKRKIGKLALSIQVAFQEMGVFETSNTKIPLSDSEAIPFSQVQVVENAEHTGDLEHFVQPMKGILSPNASAGTMKDIRSELEKALAPEILKHVVEVKASREGIVVSLREIGFYESGSANLRPASKEAIDRLAGVLKTHSELLRIEGHTDNIPIHNARFDSNWELSTARAADLIKLFITRYHFEPKRLSAAGYAEYHPVAPNDSPDNRARNRRVDIVILNSEMPEKIPAAAAGTAGAGGKAKPTSSPPVANPPAGPGVHE